MTKYSFFLSVFLIFHVLSMAQEQYYVSLTGDDGNTGTINAPLRTLEKAIGKVATAKSDEVIIYLRSGKHIQEKTLEITPGQLNTRRLRITAFNDEPAVITGAVQISPRWKPYKNKILQASIAKGLSMDRLFLNGKALHMARYPNYDPDARVFHGTAGDAISPQRVESWSNPTGGYVHALHGSEWGGFHYRITGKTGDSLHLEGGWQNNRPAPMHKEYRFVENVFEELDAPGEWYYNSATGILYLYPPGGVNLQDAVFERSVLNDLIRIKGTEAQPVQNVIIEGITFTGTNRTFMLTKEPLLRSDWTIYRGGAVLIEGAENIKIDKCAFQDLGGNAVFVSRYNRHLNFQRNHIHEIGGNAFAFVGDTSAVRSPSFRYHEHVSIKEMDKIPGPKNDLYPASCRVSDNLIHDIGQIEKQVAGIQISMAMEVTASHNTIYNVPRAGINIGDGCWGGHIIEFNDVFQTVLETGDHGAFNSWGRDRYWQADIESVDKLVAKYPDLPFLDAIKPVTIRNNRFSCEHGWDIDLDDGSSNYMIYNNVCLNGGLKLREGYRRLAENNILINNTFHPHVWYVNSQDAFVHNIVNVAYAPIRIEDWGTRIDSNLFISPSALIAARENGTDKHSITGDPQFIDAAAGDFRVQSSSPALAIGFKNFPMDSFGVISKGLKEKAVEPYITPVRTIDLGSHGKFVDWLGSTIKNIETLGEQSASGAPDKSGVLIVKVKPGSVAAKGGLQAGDVIRKINDKTIANVAELLDEMQKIGWQGSGHFTILQNQQLKTIEFRFK